MDSLKEVDPAARFDVNPTLAVQTLHLDFKRTGRVRIRNFLNPEAADAVYHHMNRNVQWRTFLISNGRCFEAPSAEGTGQTPADNEEILRFAYDSTRLGYSCVYNANRIFSEDIEAASHSGGLDESRPNPLIAALDSFWESPSFREFARSVTGLSDIKRVSSQSMRLQPGHFITFHAAARSKKMAPISRRASFFWNLTPEWKPEQGGMMEFRTPESDVVEAYVPSFNTLDLISYPQGCWVSTVSPFAPAPIFTVAGRLYAQ